MTSDGPFLELNFVDIFWCIMSHAIMWNTTTHPPPCILNSNLSCVLHKHLLNFYIFSTQNLLDNIFLLGLIGMWNQIFNFLET